MIAICAACHDYVHNGELKIEEATLRSWKRCRRNPSNTGYLYIEPGPRPRMLMGCIYWKREDEDGAIVFRLSDRNQLRFRILAGNILLVSLIHSRPNGEVIAEVKENHLTHSLCEGVDFQSHPGRIRISTPATDEFVSLAGIEAYHASNSPAPLVSDGRIALVDLQVLDSGTVQVEGAWIEADRAIISHADFLSICIPDIGFVHYRGYGEVRGDKDLSNLPTISFDGPLEISVISALLRSGGLASAHQF